MTNRFNLLGLGSAALGVIALVLPFYADHGGHFWSASPIAWFIYGWKWSIEIAVAVAPVFLSIPIIVWQLRLLGSSPLTRLEIALAYLLSTGAMLPALRSGGIAARIFWSEPEAGDSIVVATLLLATWGMAAFNLALLVWNIKRHVARHVIAEVFLLGGYLPQAVFWLVAFLPASGDTSFSSGWAIGAYVVLATCIGYLAKIAVLLKSSKSVGPSTS